MNYYTLKIAGLERQLPIIDISDNLSIASFVILGDFELIEAVAPILAEKLPDFDLLVTAEAKGIPLVHEICRVLSKKEYIVARKSIKAYMDKPLIDSVESITTKEKQLLSLDGGDAQKIKGKKIVLIDDVISTGESIDALERLVKLGGGNVVAKATILAEGNACKRDDIIYMDKLPLFEK